MSAPLEYLSSAPTTEGYRLHFVALTAEGLATLRAALGDLEASYEEMLGADDFCDTYVREEQVRVAAMLDALVKGTEAE